MYHGDDLILVHIIFGVKENLYPKGSQKKSFWGDQEAGYPVFDIEFDLSPEENQLKMEELCEEIRKSKYIVEGVLMCPIE